ncbi:MAG: hypothetical protein ACPLKP_03470 [Microgenomates group bacterium]
MEKSCELIQSNPSNTEEKNVGGNKERGNKEIRGSLKISHLPQWAQKYILLATRKYWIGEDGKLKPSSFYETYEGWGAESQEEGLNNFLNKIQSFPQERKGNLFETLRFFAKGLTSKGGVIELVKEGKANCLDWSIAVALNYNTQTRFSPPLETTEAVIVCYSSLLDRHEHFGVVIIDENNKPLVYLHYGGFYLFSRELEDIIREERDEEKIEIFKKLLSQKKDKENIFEGDEKTIRDLLASLLSLKRATNRALSKYR